MNPEEFDQLYHNSSEALKRQATRLLSDRDEAQDVVQEAFVNLWGAMDRTAKPKSSLITIVKNLCLDRLRLRGRRRDISIDDSEAEAMATHPPDYAEEQEELFAVVDRLISTRLTARDRRIMLLHDYHGWSYEDLSEEFDMPEPTLRVILSRCRKTVREAYFAINNKNNHT